MACGASCSLIVTDLLSRFVANHPAISSAQPGFAHTEDMVTDRSKRGDGKYTPVVSQEQYARVLYDEEFVEKAPTHTR